jgi:hypothetical protein
MSTLPVRPLTPQQTSILRDWVKTDDSASTIARNYGVTTNSVVGMAHRFSKRVGARGRAHLQSGFAGVEAIDFSHVTMMPVPTVVPQAKSTSLPRVRVQAVPRQKAHHPNTQQGKLQREANKRAAETLAAQLEAERAAEAVRQSAERDRLIREAQERAERDNACIDAFNRDGVLSDPVPGEPCSILDLRDYSCRAVIGEHPRVPGGRYCGERAVLGSAYCAGHQRKFFALSYVRKPQETGARLLRVRG